MLNEAGPRLFTMSNENYERARQLIEDAGGCDFEGPKPEMLVAKAESALGLRFPPSYRRFLLELGCGDINGLEVYGLIDGDFEKSTVPDGVWLTLNERREFGLDPAYLIVGGSETGPPTRSIRGRFATAERRR